MANFPDTGRYTITNVQHRNFAVLHDANDRSDIVAGAEANGDGEKWNITLLNNKKYTIKNHGFSKSAACDTRPASGDNVSGRSRNQQWIIKETRTKGQFTISPTDAELYWGLADCEIDTPITLRKTPTDNKNQTHRGKKNTPADREIGTPGIFERHKMPADREMGTPVSPQRTDAGNARPANRPDQARPRQFAPPGIAAPGIPNPAHAVPVTGNQRIFKRPNMLADREIGTSPMFERPNLLADREIAAPTESKNQGIFERHKMFVDREMGTPWTSKHDADAWKQDSTYESKQDSTYESSNEVRAWGWSQHS
ncbi:hypothetical protein C8R44DRAFT_819362 [Mycena epipterygia]|nr:hypothetical protein C8R44DRAFT_819362 [Mycena epipterygia]